jgi:hypothetical protein
MEKLNAYAFWNTATVIWNYYYSNYEVRGEDNEIYR